MAVLWRVMMVVGTGVDARTGCYETRGLEKDIRKIRKKQLRFVLVSRQQPGEHLVSNLTWMSC